MPFPCALPACLSIKENRRTMSRQLLPLQIHQPRICYLNTNDTANRRGSVVRGRRGFDRCALTWSPGRPGFGAEVRVEIGYLKTPAQRSVVFKGDRLSVSSSSFDTSCLKSITISSDFSVQHLVSALLSPPVNLTFIYLCIYLITLYC